MTSIDDARHRQEAAAAERYAARTDQRREQIRHVADGDLAAANTPARIANRIDRLSRWRTNVQLPQLVQDTPHGAPEQIATEALTRTNRAPLSKGIATAVLETAGAQPIEAAGKVLERIINTADFLDVRYFEDGVVAARAVGRIQIRDRAGDLEGYGTGSLVSSRLLLTNHHVLGDAETAAGSVVEFDFQDGRDGQPLHAKVFRLDPATFFLADAELDFALVAVGAGPEPLARFGFNRLIEARGKAVVGEHVTIVQHPRGEKKQVALRENAIVDIADPFLHYEADTEPGSSGSPVFNDQWEVVALHHASTPAPDRPELGGFQNEGILVREIVAFVRSRPHAPAQQALVDELVVPDRTPEAIAIDPDYANRRGYDAAFLGDGRARVPLPELSAALLAQAATVAGDGAEAHVLRYHNFSVVQSRVRRLAFFTAVNIDGALSERIRRERDRWTLDPRIPAGEQTGEGVYAANPLDRGHLVRRLDPAWGADARDRKAANDDTFHFTNCAPQHEDFNQNQTTWAGLEDYVLENADNRDLRVNVFSGPVFAADDDAYRGVQLPRQFWKVVTIVKASGELSATAYLLSQEQLLHGLEREAEFSYGAYRTFQVPVARVAQLTGLSFGPLEQADPLTGLESTATLRPVDEFEDVVL